MKKIDNFWGWRGQTKGKPRKTSKEVVNKDMVKLVVSEMTYTVSSGTLNSTIPYHGKTGIKVLWCNGL